MVPLLGPHTNIEKENKTNISTTMGATGKEVKIVIEGQNPARAIAQADKAAVKQRKEQEKVARKEVKKEMAKQPGKSAGQNRSAAAVHAVGADTRRLANQNAIEKHDRRMDQGSRGMPAHVAKFEKALEAKGVGKLPLMIDWLRAAQDPLRMPPAKCPVQKNLIESNRTTVCSTVYTARKLISNTAKLDIVLFPGHGVMPQYSVAAGGGDTSSAFNMDPQSFHSKLQTIGSTAYALGPVGDGQTPYSTVGFTRAAGIDEFFTTSSTAAGAEALNCVTPLPYTAQADAAGHTRWRMTALALKIVVDNYDGSIGVRTASPLGRSVALTGNVGFDTVFAKNPSYTKDQISPVSGKAERTFVVPWQPDQLAFWHTISTSFTNGAAATGVTHGSFFCQLENLGSAGAWVDLEVVAHWELAGDSLLSVSTATAQSVGSASIADQTTGKLNKVGTATHAVAAASSSISDTFQSLSGLVSTGLEVGRFVASLF